MSDAKIEVKIAWLESLQRSLVDFSEYYHSEIEIETVQRNFEVYAQDISQFIREESV